MLLNNNLKSYDLYKMGEHSGIYTTQILRFVYMCVFVCVWNLKKNQDTDWL